MVISSKYSFLVRYKLYNIISIFVLISCHSGISGKLNLNEKLDISKVFINIKNLKDKNKKYSIKIKENGEFYCDSQMEDGNYLIEIFIPDYKIINKKIILKNKNFLNFKLIPMQDKTKLIEINSNKTNVTTGPVSVSPADY